MTQRLALHHILTTQLAKNWEREESAKNRLSKMTGRIRSSMRAVHVPARYHAMMPDSRKTYDKMVERIHQTMQEVRPKRRPLPAVALPDTAIPAESAEAPPLPSTLVSKHYSKRLKSNRVKGGGHPTKAGGSAHASVAKSNMKPLALIRAGLNLKTHRAKIGGGEARNNKGFAVQKQMNEVIRQKNVLETMLVQHKRLRQDRETIVMDMQRMRADLDRICNKLDTSLQNLNSTRTLSSTAPQPKGAIQKMVSHSRVVRRKAKTNPTPTNRQGTVVHKARKGGVQKKPTTNVLARRFVGILKGKTNPVSVNRQRVHAH